MTPEEGQTVHPVGNGSKPAVAPLGVAAPRPGHWDDIDDALDGVVGTLDDLVRDLAAEAVEARPVRYVALPERAPAPPRPEVVAAPVARAPVAKRSTLQNVALVAAVVLVALVVEYVLLEAIISSP
jgi:hypothetical protein